MASNQHSTTRRNILAGIAATTAVAATAPALASNAVNQSVNSEWEAALAQYRHALSEMNSTYHPILDGPTRRHDEERTREAYEIVREAEDRWAVYCTAHFRAAEALCLAPAPTLDAIKLKLEIAGEIGILTNGTTEHVRAMIADLERLGANNPILVERPI